MNVECVNVDMAANRATATHPNAHFKYHVLIRIIFVANAMAVIRPLVQVSDLKKFAHVLTLHLPRLRPYFLVLCFFVSSRGDFCWGAADDQFVLLGFIIQRIFD